MRRWLIQGLLVLLIAAPGAAQTYQFKNYNVEEGLSGSFVYTINQDERGFIWLGTSAGISLFDGFSFYSVNLPDSTDTGFPESSLDLRNGTVLYGFSSGSAYCSSGSELVRVPGIEAFRINEILENEAGEAFLLTQSKGIYLYTPGKSEAASKLSSPEDYIIYSGAIAGDNQLLLGTQQGLYMASIETDHIVPDYEIEELHFLKVQSIIKSPFSQSFYIGTEDDGVFRVEPGEGSATVSRILDNERFNQMRVQSLIFDDFNNLWISTFGNGVVKVELSETGEEVTRSTYFTRETGLAGNDARRTYQDEEGNIWIGHFGNGVSIMASDAYSLLVPGQGENMNNIISLWDVDELIFAGTDRGYYLYDLDRNKTVSYTDLSKYAGSSRITSYCKYPGGGFIFGTESEGAYISDSRGSVRKYFYSTNNLENYISDISCDGNYTWIGTRSGVVQLDVRTGDTKTYTTYENLPHNSINQVFPDGTGKVYVATQGNRLYIIDPLSGVSAGKAVIYGGGRNEFQSFDIDDEGTVWGATLGKGVYSFAGDSLRRLSTEEGLLNNHCYSILADRNNNIWIGHEQGFSIYDRELGQVRTFVDIFDSGADYNENAIYETTSGLVIMGTTNGFMVYNPGLDRVRLKPPKTNIISVVIDGNEYPLQESYGLPYKIRHDITINFAGLYYSDPEKVYYRYRMEHYDEEW